MRVGPVMREAGRLSCLVESKGNTSELFFECSNLDCTRVNISGNWIVPALLLSCMRLGEPLLMEEPISPILLRKLQTIQDIYKAWIPGYSGVEVVAPAQELPPSQERTALLFSGGVDSFYSLLKHKDRISDLIVLHGFEFPWDQEAKFREHLQSVRSVAEEFGKRVIIVRTNVRDHLRQHTHWDFAHGAALASVGLCFEGTISECIIASTCAYDQLHAWGSHPILDPLWSTGALKFLHDGCEAKRVDKLRTISASDLAMKYLRACDNESSSVNCGQCEKCLRTMVGLHVLGKLTNCPAMPHRIDPHLVRMLRLDEGSAIFFRELLSFAIEPPRLRRAINYALKNQRFGLRPVPHVYSIRSRTRRIADIGRLLGRVFLGPG